MAKVTIVRADYERADGRAALYAIVYICRQRIRIPVGVAVAGSDWDPVKQRVRGRSSEAADSNLIISNTKARISDVLVRARLLGQPLTKIMFDEMYLHPGENSSFIEFARANIVELRKFLQPETMRHHVSIIDKLERHAPGLRFGDITTDWLRAYVVYLRDTHHNNPNTINKNLSVIRAHYYAAMRAGKVQSNPFEGFKMPRPEPAIIFLTEPELQKLADLYKSDTLPDNQQDVLRFFLFMTFTGMHISDARALQIEQIFAGEIHYSRIKNGRKVAVPLSESATELVAHYSGIRRRGNLFVDLPTDQAFNRLIKIIADKVGIRKSLSAKAARHTFATIIYRKTKDIATLSRMLGHASINTTMIYAHTIKDARAESVRSLDGFL